MTVLIIIILVLMVLALALVVAMSPIDSRFSMFEATRRRDMGDNSAKLDIKRSHALVQINRLKQGVLLLMFLVIMSVANAVISGIYVFLLLIIIIFLVLFAAKMSFVARMASNIYEKNEKAILRQLKKPLVKFFVGVKSEKTNKKLGSIFELEDIVKQSSGVLTDQEKSLVINSITFGHKKVGKIMVKKDGIKTIHKDDFLGPLVLNDLYEAGFDRLPVIDQDINHIVGILNIKSLLNLNNKRSAVAEKSMEKEVCFVKENDSLVDALAVFMASRNDLMIVINNNRETVGLITIEDIIEALFGRKISIDFDDHNNIHAVAKR